MADQTGRALYLAWRPRTFGEVVGQEHCVRTIRNAVKHGTIAHAYLFAGPRGTGKTTMARLLFKAVNCLEPLDGGSCERCDICVSANEGRALDLVELDAASNRGIDDVRDLRDKINYAPAEAKYRVYILDEAHQLTQAAWDALLKTLEEPPPHAILVLATTESHKVPATVLSRCQRFDFHRISAADIRHRLAAIAAEEGLEIEPTVLSWLARAARGGLRDAISLLDQLRAFAGDAIDAESAREVLGLAGLETVRPFLVALCEGRPGEALDGLNEAVERGADLRVFVGDALAYLRALLLLRYGATAALRAEFPTEELEWLEQQATEWEASQLRRLVGALGDALARFRDPTQLLIQVELALLGGWSAPDEPPVAAARPGTAGSARRPLVASTPDRPAAEAADRSTQSVGGPPTDSTTPAEASSIPGPGSSASVAESSAGDAPAPTTLTVESQSVQASDDLMLSAIATAGDAAQVVVDVAESPGPSLDPSVARARWPQARQAVAQGSLVLSWLHHCEYVGLESGNVLVLSLPTSLRKWLEDRQRRLTLETALSKEYGQTIRVRLAIDAQANGSAAEAGSPPASMRTPADDPVIKKALMLFGGTLQRVDAAHDEPKGAGADAEGSVRQWW